MLKHILFASAVGLMATAAFADPDKDESGKGRVEWRGDDRRDDDRYYSKRSDYQYGTNVPNGHLPPPGECRVWFHDRPAGQQPPPTSCDRAERQASRYGGRVLYGGDRNGADRFSYNDQRQFQRWAINNFDYNRDGRLSQREYRVAIDQWNRR